MIDDTKTQFVMKCNFASSNFLEAWTSLQYVITCLDFCMIQILTQPGSSNVQVFDSLYLKIADQSTLIPFASDQTEHFTYDLVKYDVQVMRQLLMDQYNLGQTSGIFSFTPSHEFKYFVLRYPKVFSEHLSFVFKDVFPMN